MLSDLFYYLDECNIVYLHVPADGEVWSFAIVLNIWVKTKM